MNYITFSFHNYYKIIKIIAYRMHRINIYELMTWKRGNHKTFPFGPSILPCILSALLILIPSTGLAISLICKGKSEYLGFLVIINIIIHLSMVKCVMTNPGIIPQILPNRQRAQQLLQIPISRSNDQDRRYLIASGGLNLCLKYCYQCKIFRPPRAIHCASCNHCVQKYDHHCPWLSICIGKFNYIYFISYIVSLTLLSLYSSVLCLYIIVCQIEAQAYFVTYLVQVLVGALSLFFVFPLLRLSAYHTSIILDKRTTNQDLKEIYGQRIQLPFEHLYSLKRDQFFNDSTEYYMDKKYENSSSKDSKQKTQNTKQIMLTTLYRQINDTTRQSTSAVIPPQRYSITATDRSSVFNYLLQNQPV